MSAYKDLPSQNYLQVAFCVLESFIRRKSYLKKTPRKTGKQHVGFKYRNNLNLELKKTVNIILNRCDQTAKVSWLSFDEKKVFSKISYLYNCLWSPVTPVSDISFCYWWKWGVSFSTGCWGWCPYSISIKTIFWGPTQKDG